VHLAQSVRVRGRLRLLDSGELGRVVGASASVVWHRTPQYYGLRSTRGERERVVSREAALARLDPGIHWAPAMTGYYHPRIVFPASRKTLAPRASVEGREPRVTCLSSGGRRVSGKLHFPTLRSEVVYGELWAASLVPGVGATGLDFRAST
jgi:hypothetical protein